MILEWSHRKQFAYSQKRARKQRERARRRGLPGTILAVDWLDVLRQWGECCAYCGRHADTAGMMTIDHFIPLAAPDSPGFVLGNTVPACSTCNHSKASHEPRQWVQDTFGNDAPAILDRIDTYLNRVGNS